MKSHIMIDLETAALGPRAKIMSIGAVKFRMDPEVPGFYELLEGGETFYANIEQEHYSSHFEADSNTLKWWSQQSEAARKALQEHQVPINKALVGLRDWITNVSKPDSDPFVWANAPQFDLIKLSEHFDVHGIRQPWHFRMERDCRTWKHVGNIMGCHYDMNPVWHEAIQHDALHDAIVQVIEVKHIFRQLVQMRQGVLGPIAEAMNRFIKGEKA